MQNGLLDPKHLKELRASGLTPETIKKSGVWSATFKEVEKLLNDDRIGSGGLVFPYPTLDGSEEPHPYVVVKLDQALDPTKRYRIPRKRGNRLYAPPTLDRAILRDTSIELYVTEGQKKTLAAIQEGLACVGLTGVFSWRTKDDKGFKVAIPDLDDVEWGGRKVNIVFDSDAATNPNVLLAEKMFGAEMNRRGARAFSIRLPEGPDGKKVGLDDYLLKHDKEEFDRLERRELTEEWLAPLAFDEPRLPEFPVDVFPQWLQHYVVELSTEVQTPVDLAAAQVLGVLGTALAGKVIVEINPDWHVPLNIWLAVRMRSGEGKSPVVRKANKPLLQHEAEERESLRGDIAAATELYKVKRERLDNARKRAAKAPVEAVYKQNDKGEPVYDENGNMVVEKQSRQACEDEVARLAAELAATLPPAEPRYLVDDVTPEKLAVIMAQNHGRVAIVADEGGIFQIMGGRYSKTGEANLDIFLKGWAGDMPYIRDRIGDIGQPVKVEKPLITFVVSVQPDVINGLRGRREFRARGLMARFLYSLPATMLGRRKKDPALMHERTVLEYDTKMRRILAIPCSEVDRYYDPYVLKLSEDARQILIDFKGELEPRLADDMNEVSDWGSKLVGELARIAGLLHIAEPAAETDPLDKPVAADLMQRVVKLGRDYYVPHAKAAFSLLGQDEVVENAKYIIEFVKRKDWKEFSMRDLHHATGAKFETVSQLDKPLELLVAHEYLRERLRDPKTGPGRKASRKYVINTLLVGEDRR